MINSPFTDYILYLYYFLQNEGGGESQGLFITCD